MAAIHAVFKHLSTSCRFSIYESDANQLADMVERAMEKDGIFTVLSR